MSTIYYLPDNQEIAHNDGDNILVTSNRGAIPHTQICRGNARCSTCRVLIVEGLEYCSAPNDKEILLAEKLGFSPDIRLACQTKVNGNIKLRRMVLDSEDAHLANKLAAEKTPCLVGEEKQLAILFADIRGFTSFSERMLPCDVIHMLNRYFNKMGMIISDNDGRIDNYMGDGLLALFESKDLADTAFKAVKAATEMLEAIVDLNLYIEPLYKWKMEIGIGIHLGEVVVGTVGSGDNKRSTVIGDAVNLASRIETANKEVGTNLLISEVLYQLIRSKVQIGKQVSLKLKGKSGEYSLYEAVGLSS